MALSLSNFLYLCSSFLLWTIVSADTITYNFTVGWVTTNPDGAFDRPTIGINGQWPIPRIEANVGDRIVIHLYNDLGNQSTSLHFHGLFMNGTNEMDGVVGGTQCAIPSGSTFTYNFTIDQPGTYWYHSHNDGQYPDGLRGPLIIHDPDSPYAGQYDEELIVTLSDWYHDQMQTLIPQFLSVTNPTGAEPVPNAALMNDTQNLEIHVQPGKTYLLRLINIGAFAGQYFWIEGHTFRIVEVDGIYTEAAEAEMIYITAAQRYSVLLTTKNSTTTNYAMVSSMDEDLFDKVPEELNPNATSFLVYNSADTLPTPSFVDEFDPFDDFTLVPYDREPLFENPDLTVDLAVMMDNLGDGKNYAFFNGITYVRPKVPTLYTALTTNSLAADPDIYGVNTHAFVLGHNQVIEIVLNNHDPGKHPFHLHGHTFQTLVRGDDDSGDFIADNATFPAIPMRRDTFMVRPNGHIVMRFRSDNPGIWIFHCHIEWHVDSGLTMTFIEAPMEIQANITIPADHYAACAALSPPMATAGNAAGNTENLLDLTGANVSPAPLPAGFTPRGIIALVFSAAAGILGMMAIVWYGMAEMGEIERSKEERAVERLSESKAIAGQTPSMGSRGDISAK